MARVGSPERWVKRVISLLAVVSFTFEAAPLWAEPGGGQTMSRLALARLDNALGALADAPLDPWPLQSILDASAEGGGIDVAIARAREMADAPGAGEGARLVVGLLLAAAGHHAEALAVYRAIEAAHPRRFEAAALVARAEEALGRADAAKEAWDRAVAAVGARSDKDLRRRVLEEALAQAEAVRDLPRARDLAARLVAVDPRDETLLVAEAQLLGRLGDVERALERWAAIETRAGAARESRVAAIGEQAALLQGAGRFEAAEAAWRRALSVFPRGHHGRGPVWAGLVGVARVAGRLRALVPELRAESGRDPDVALILPSVLEELGQDAEAATAWRDAIGRAPRRPEPHLGLVRLLERTGPEAALLAALRALVASDRREPRFRFQLVDRLEAMARRADAATELRALAREFGSDPGILQEVLARWVRRTEAKDRKDIEEVFGRLLRAEPGEIDHLLGFGSWHWSIGDKDAALDTWRRVSDVPGVGRRGHLELARILFDYERYDDAEQALRAALESAPDDPEALRLRAAIATRRRRHADAEATWRELQRMAPAGSAAAAEAEEAIIEGWSAQRALDARLAVLMRDTDAALERGDLGPKTFADLRLVIRGLIAAARLDEASRWLERLNEASPGPAPPALVRVAEDVAFRRGDLVRARREAVRLAELEPPSAVAHLRRAAGHALAAGDSTGAVALAERALAASPTDPLAHRALAEVLLAAGREEAALAALASAAALDPADTDLRLRLAALHRARGALTDEAALLLGIVRDASSPMDVERAGGRLLQIASSNPAAGLLPALEAAVRARAERGDDPGARRLYLGLIQRAAIEAEVASPDEADEIARRLGERAVPTLIAALSGTDPEARDLALSILMKTRTPATAPIVARLLDVPDPAVAARAAAVLGEIGDAASVAALTPLATGSDSRRRELALWAFGLRTNPGALPLVERASWSSSAKERALAAMAFGPLPPPESHGLLLRLLKDSAADVREAAVAASRRWFIARTRLRDLDPATHARDARVLVETLLGALDHFAGRQPELPTLVLGALSTPLPAEALAAARLAIVARLFRAPGEDGALLAWLAGAPDHGGLASESDEVRIYREAHAALLDPLRGFIPRLSPIRATSARFAGVASDLPADEVVAAVTAHVAGHLGLRAGFDEALTGHILRALDVPTHPIVRAVAADLARSGEGLASPLLQISVRHADPHVRALALSLLARLPGGRDLARARVDALAEAGHADALPAIAATSLVPPSAAVTAALERLAPSRAPPALAAALAALDACRPRPSRQRLAAWLEHPTSRVRTATLEALLESLERGEAGVAELRAAIDGLTPRLREIAVGADDRSAVAARALLSRLDRSVGAAARPAGRIARSPAG